MNLKFTISYDGSVFFGSQKQPNKNTVEDELLKVFKTFNIDTKIILLWNTILLDWFKKIQYNFK